MLIGVRPGRIRQRVLSAEMKKAPAAQLAAAGVDQDTGNPCFKQLRLPQVLESLQRTADCFGNRVQRVCLASQIQVSRSVQPRLDCFRPGSKFLLVHSLPSFTLFYLLDAGERKKPAAPSACRFLRSWMRLLIYILQLVFDHMGIDLGGRNIRMTQHFLNGPEVCTVFQQMHRK